MAAVYVEGSTGLSIDDCQFERLDGNGVMLSGFNRAASVGDKDDLLPRHVCHSLLNVSGVIIYIGDC